MTHVYIVRCNFTAPDKEQAWNDWYSGPKIKQMLAQPHFLSCQRFHRTAGSGRDYLALWTIETPEALETPPYTSQWGFAEGRPMSPRGAATCSTPARPFGDFAVAHDGALEVVSFDGMNADDMKATNAAIVQAGRHDVAADRRARPSHAGDRLPRAADTGKCRCRRRQVQHGVYRPICEFQGA